MKEFKQKLLQVSDQLLLKKMAKFGQLILFNKSKQFIINFQPKNNQTVILIPSSGSIDKYFSKPVKLYLCKPVNQNNSGNSRTSILSHHSCHNQCRTQQRFYCKQFQQHLNGKRKQQRQKLEQFLQNYQEKHEVQVRLDQSYWIERKSLTSKQGKSSLNRKQSRETNILKKANENIIISGLDNFKQQNIKKIKSQYLFWNDQSSFQQIKNQKWMKNKYERKNIILSQNGFQHNQPIKQSQFQKIKKKQNFQSISNQSLLSGKQKNNQQLKITQYQLQKKQFRLPVQVEVRNKKKKKIIDLNKQIKINDISPLTNYKQDDSQIKKKQFEQVLNSFQQYQQNFIKNSLNDFKYSQFENQLQQQIEKSINTKKQLLITSDKQISKLKYKIKEIQQKLQDSRLCADEKEMLLSQANKLMRRVIKEQKISNRNTQMVMLTFILILGIIIIQIIQYFIF